MGRRMVRFPLLVLSAGYAIGLIGYLVLRLLIGDRYWLLAFVNNFAPFLFLPLLIFLPITLLLRVRWLISAMLILTVIGAIWIGPYYLPKAHAAANGSTLRIVTFNIWGDNTRLTEVEAWLRQINADVVFLQEIPQTYAKHGVAALKDLYPYQFNQNVKWGNLTLSRYPFLTTESVDAICNCSLPAEQRVTINVNGQMIAFYNVHLAFPAREKPRLYLSPRLPFVPFANLAVSYDPEARNREVANLLTLLKTENRPHIVAGDFNMSDQTALYQEVAGLMHDTFREVGSGYGGSWPVSEAFGTPEFLPPLVRIDYIWHSDQFRAVEVQQGPKLGSDHLPLHGTLALAGK